MVASQARLRRLVRRQCWLLRRPTSQARQWSITLADVEPQTVLPLWDSYLARGKLTLAEGDGGTGKSLPHGRNCSSHVQWLHAGPHALSAVRGPSEDVLMLLAEDSIADTIRPRLEAMGADLRRIKILTGILTEGGELPLMLDEDGLRELDRAIEIHHPALVIIDPVVQHLGAKIDMFKPNHVRGTLTPIMTMAARHGCAIVIVRHLKKGSGGNAAYRGQGSQDFYNASRSVLLIGRDPHDPHRSIMVHEKCNYAAKGPAQAFSIEGGEFTWLGEVEITADELLAASDATSHDEVLDLYDPEADQPITSNVLVTELGMTASAARQRLHRMAKSGLLVKTGHGRYLPNTKRDTRSLVTVSHSSQADGNVTSVTERQYPTMSSFYTDRWPQ